MLRRWWIYLREVFQPGPRTLFSLALYLGIQLTIQALRGRAPLAVTADIGPGVATLVLILLYYRLSDEFKDADTDRLYFPDRPVPSGRVRLEDLRVLLWLTVGTLVAINAIWGRAVVAFAALLGFAFLMRHWFFAERLLSRNRLLAFVTHAPVSVLANLFVLSVHCRRFGEPFAERDVLLVAVWFALPGYAWEIGRKTRAPAEEQAGYQTYSQMLGARASALLALAFVGAHAAGFAAIGARVAGGWSAALVAVVAIAAAGTLIVFGRFVVDPRESRLLRPATESYGFATTIALIADHVVRRGLVWVGP